MRGWLLLSGAIGAEVIGTLSLRAMVDQPAWVALTAAAYVVAYALLGLALRTGMPIGVAYGIWGAVGVALVALLGALIFGETMSAQAIIGIVVIIAGVLIVETGARPATDTQSAEAAA